MVICVYLIEVGAQLRFVRSVEDIVEFELRSKERFEVGYLYVVRK